MIRYSGWNPQEAGTICLTLQKKKYIYILGQYHSVITWSVIFFKILWIAQRWVWDIWCFFNIKSDRNAAVVIDILFCLTVFQIGLNLSLLFEDVSLAFELYSDSLVQNCGNSIANAMELPPFCTKAINIFLDLISSDIALIPCSRVLVTGLRRQGRRWRMVRTRWSLSLWILHSQTSPSGTSCSHSPKL